MEDLIKSCTFFSLALDESTDICGIAQLGIFIQGKVLKKQREIAVDVGNLTKYVDKIQLLHESFENHFQDFAKEENSFFTFANPFVLHDEHVMKLPSSIQMELIDLKTNSLLKTKFDELHLVQNARNTINFWRSLPHESFSELQTFAQSFIYCFGSTYRCEQAFSSMNLIKNKVTTHRFKFEELFATLCYKFISRYSKTGKVKTESNITLI